MIEGEPDPLIVRALAAHEDSSERWELARALRAHADRATFEALAALLVDADSAARVLAADVLGQFGVADDVEGGAGAPAEPSERPFWSAITELINARISAEQEPGALQSAIAAAGHLRDPRAVTLLRARRGHGDQFVRWSIVMALAGLDDDLAADTLVEFLGDPSALVRDWAAFAFGVTMPERDSPAIRSALLKLLADEDLIARSEAMRALALRGVAAEAVEALLLTLPHRDELENYDPLDDALLLIAAQTADPRLREYVLRELREWDDALDQGEELPDRLLAAASAYLDGE